MHFQTIIIATFSASLVSGHGVISWVRGANGVDMSGLTVIEDTLRNCAGDNCGFQADTDGGALASKAIANFMGTDLQGRPLQKRKRQLGTFFEGLFGGGKSVKAAITDDEPARLTPGAGRRAGLPTTYEDNSISFVYHLVNQDDTGPYTCEVDPTSGGTDPSAYIPCQLTQNVPEVVDVPHVVEGIPPTTTTTTTKTSFDCEAQFPEDMLCRATVAGVKNVCVFKVYNDTPAGPYGGYGAFTQSPILRKKLGGVAKMQKRGSPFMA
ncbi:hypothetical protein AA313_de0207700 [Arthrobotrys entomopaga]|nr:hypothetical protein AA313_de0207700 [Arthrobotrys entomopaga]